jgi:hypothetical protein
MVNRHSTGVSGTSNRGLLPLNPSVPLPAPLPLPLLLPPPLLLLLPPAWLYRWLGGRRGRT